MSNYNSQLQSNNTDLQTVLQALQTKATAGQATPEISVSSNGLITATAGTKSSTHQLAFQPAKTVTPGTTSQIAVSSGYFTGGNVMVAGDANLVAANIKSGVSIFGVSGTLEEGSGSGEAAEWSENEDAIIMGTISNYTNDRVKIIGSHAFYECSSLMTVNFPACVHIKNQAFAYCGKLTTVNFPACEHIFNNAFSGCYNLTAVSFPKAVYIESQAFVGCNKLTAVNLPRVTDVGVDAFTRCHKLTTVSLPRAICIKSKAFDSCSELASVFLANRQLTTLSNSNAFSFTSMSIDGWFYVPSSLITSYQAATNWAYYSSRFSVIEDSPDWDGGYAGIVLEEGEIWFSLIGADEYIVQEGMTWREWVNSEYNTYGFYTDGTYILREVEDPFGLILEEYIYNNDWSETLIDDAIIAWHEYWISA